MPPKLITRTDSLLEIDTFQFSPLDAAKSSPLCHKCSATVLSVWEQLRLLCCSTCSREALINACACVKTHKGFPAPAVFHEADLQKLTGQARDGRNRFCISFTRIHAYTFIKKQGGFIRARTSWRSVPSFTLCIRIIKHPPTFNRLT